MILYVGRINTRQKRFQSLLNIWKRLQNELLDYRLEIVGGGPEKNCMRIWLMKCVLNVSHFMIFKIRRNIIKKPYAVA